MTSLSDFEWSPEALEAARRALLAEGPPATYVDDYVLLVLHAVEKAQPVVALPPCPTCDGEGWKAHTEGHLYNCPACNGSGVERMVPLSEIVAWLRRFHYTNAVAAAALEREFGGDR